MIAKQSAVTLPDLRSGTEPTVAYGEVGKRRGFDSRREYMEIVKEHCDECGHKEQVCPECGGDFVNPVENIDGRIRGKVKKSVLSASDGESFTIKQFCWDCGSAWERTVTVAVEKVE